MLVPLTTHCLQKLALQSINAQIKKLESSDGEKQTPYAAENAFIDKSQSAMTPKREDSPETAKRLRELGRCDGRN